MSRALIEALAVTAEVCGTQFTDAASRAIVAKLSTYPEAIVLKALNRCMEEVTGRLSLAHIVQRINELNPDGRPGAEEAWAMLPRSEAESVCWTQEMSQAWGIVKDLDQVAGRMAFKEVYNRIVDENRNAGIKPVWIASYGHDPEQRANIERETHRRNGILVDQQDLNQIAYQTRDQGMQAFTSLAVAFIEAPEISDEEKLKRREEIRKLRDMLGGGHA